MTLQDEPVAKVRMLIEVPVEQAFEAFVGPSITTLS